MLKGDLELCYSLIEGERIAREALDSCERQGGDQFFLYPLPNAVPEALASWLRIGCVCCRNLHDSAT